MSVKKPLRKDKTCLNCNAVVDQRYCPNCGQENTDTRKTFYQLFIHFFEDLTHYENAFWKTIRNLIVKPAALTKEYLSGKRLSYLAPIRLYIFINFATFFLFAIIPDQEDSDNLVKIKNPSSNRKVELTLEEQKFDDLVRKGFISKKVADSLKMVFKESKANPKKDNLIDFGYDSVKEMDSIRKVKPSEINDIEYWLAKKMIPLNEKYTNEELTDKFAEGLERNFPKTLFFFMPLFALILWIFHNKKRFYYFDNGIFTLHYFSFLLLISLLLFLIDKLLQLIGDFIVIDILKGIINFVGYLWMFIYFFPAHKNFYEESRIKSFIKSIFIFFIAFIFFVIMLILLFLYTFINIH